MRISVGSDHAAIGLRGAIVAWLRSAGHEVAEVGPAADERTDYPLQAAAVARSVAAGDRDRGILVCGTGIGMSIAANKIPGVRAALVHDPLTARLAGEHNAANVLCLGGRLLAEPYALELVALWLASAFEARHQPRIDLVTALDSERL